MRADEFLVLLFERGDTVFGARAIQLDQLLDDKCLYFRKLGA